MPMQPMIDDWDGENDYEYFPDEVYHLADQEMTGTRTYAPKDETPWPEDEGEPAFAAYEEEHDDDDYD